MVLQDVSVSDDMALFASLAYTNARINCFQFCFKSRFLLIDYFDSPTAVFISFFVFSGNMEF
jgi:hypothetical protein